MDSRQPPPPPLQQQHQHQQQPPHHTFASQQDRLLIHNQNHSTVPQSQSQSQSQSQYSYGSHPGSQPPVHVPYGGPFQRHDPFVPNSQQRRTSYGLHKDDNTSGHTDRSMNGPWGTGGHQLNNHPAHPSHSSTQSNAPPSLPLGSVPNTTNQAAPASDSTRRRSLGDQSGMRHPHAQIREGPPPPPPFASRQMYPPSPQSQKQNTLPSGYRSSSLSYSGNRDLPGLTPNFRPGSSMSISSIIGGDQAAPQQNAQSSPPTTTAQSPTHRALQSMSPKRIGPGMRSDPRSHKGQTSTKKSMQTNQRPRGVDRNNYAINSPSRTYPSGSGSPDVLRHGGPPAGNFKLAGTHRSPVHGQVSTGGEGTEKSTRRQSAAIMPPRPSSQPTNFGETRNDSEYRPYYDLTGLRRPSTSQSPEEKRRPPFHEYAYQKHPTSDHLGERDRPVTAQPLSQAVYSPPKDGTPGQAYSHPKPSQQPSQQPYWRSSGRREDDQRDPSQSSREESVQAYSRQIHGPHTTPNPSQPNFGNEDVIRPSRSLDHLGHHRIVEQYHLPPTSDPGSAERMRSDRMAQSALGANSGLQPRGPAYDTASRKSGDELLSNKSFLGLGPEANRRTGRASPLPQAVQGAQSQPVGPGGDPSIKSEFGRMFSGLGSGLVSSRPGNGGSTTPSRQSPLPHNHDEMLLHSDIPGPPELPTGVVQTGRKGRQIKDEDGPFDNESGDGRGNPMNTTQRGSKRPKHTHPTHHHHHHHVQGHHHHHHHHKLDEDSGLTGGNNLSIPTMGPFNHMRLSHNHHVVVSTVPGGQPGLHHIHYHHPSPHHHHHHHVPRLSPPAAVSTPPAPTRTVQIQSVLDSVAKFPRDHLGSRLYEADVMLPPPSTPLDDKFGYSSRYKGLHFGAEQSNCTLTLRVPRYFLKAKEREQICRQRQVWGTVIYREDSDPVAAAIHSGWIRGAWNEDVNVELLDPRILGPRGQDDSNDVVYTKPGAPIEPPPDTDLHLTLLILPGLEEYHSRIEYGLKSRASQDSRGMSFMISKIQWVDEGTGTRGMERGAAARKKRLDAGNALVSLAIGRPINGEIKGQMIRA